MPEGGKGTPAPKTGGGKGGTSWDDMGEYDEKKKDAREDAKATAPARIRSNTDLPEALGAFLSGITMGSLDVLKNALGMKDYSDEEFLAGLAFSSATTYLLFFTDTPEAALNAIGGTVGSLTGQLGGLSQGVGETIPL